MNQFDFHYIRNLTEELHYQKYWASIDFYFYMK